MRVEMLTFPSQPVHEVLILGAGFSKSLSDSMPLIDGLGSAVLPLVSERGGVRLPQAFGRGQFETWLSRIAEDQPDLETADNLANRFVFQLCSEALAEVLTECVLEARQDALNKDWIRGLLGMLHARQSTMLTFNQDTLVEVLVAASDLRSWNRRQWPVAGPQPGITWSDVLNGQPSLPPQWLAFDQPQQTFRLLKLHGSIHWYWRAGDESGATVASWFPPGLGSPDEAIPDERAAIQRLLPGRVPLIVPPSAGKTTYYRTPLLTQLWRDARKALQRANLRVSLLGYSIPATDLVTSGMLRESIANREDVTIDVVNPCPTPVRQNLESLGIDPGQISEVVSIEEFAHKYELRAAAELVEEFRHSKLDNLEALLLVGSGLAGSRKVVALNPKPDGELELVLEDDVPPYTGTNVSPSGLPPPLGLRQLIATLNEPRVTRLVAVASSGKRHTVVAAAEHTTAVGAGNGRWQVLITPRSPAS